MDYPRRISLDRLVGVYGRMGFVQDYEDPHAFVRDADGVMFFHEPDQGEFSWELVFLNIFQTEHWLVSEEDLARRFLRLLSEDWGWDEEVIEEVYQSLSAHLSQW